MWEYDCSFHHSTDNMTSRSRSVSSLKFWPEHLCEGLCSGSTWECKRCPKFHKNDLQTVNTRCIWGIQVLNKTNNCYCINLHRYCRWYRYPGVVQINNRMLTQMAGEFNILWRIFIWPVIGYKQESYLTNCGVIKIFKRHFMLP